MNLCPACSTPNEGAAKFCKQCGHRFIETTNGTVLSCSKCGQETPAKGKFCKFCGAATSTPAETVSATPPLSQDTPVAQVAASLHSLKETWQQASSNPAILLGQARLPGKGSSIQLNLLEYSAAVAVVALLAGFWLFGLWQFGLQSMLLSGTPFFLAYLVALLLGLIRFKAALDRPLAPVYRQLSKIPYPTRAVIGLALPFLWCLFDSKDLGSGFMHAATTVTIATLLSHVMLRSGEHE